MSVNVGVGRKGTCLSFEQSLTTLFPPLPPTCQPLNPRLFLFLLDSQKGEQNSPYQLQPDAAACACLCMHEDNPLPLIGSSLTYFFGVGDDLGFILAFQRLCLLNSETVITT